MNELMECVITHSQDWLMLDMSNYVYHATMTVPANEETRTAAYDTTRVACLIGTELQYFDIDASFDEVTLFVRKLKVNQAINK